MISDIERLKEYLKNSDKKHIQRLIKSDKKWAEFNSRSARMIYEVKIKLTDSLSRVNISWEINDELKELAKQYL